MTVIVGFVPTPEGRAALDVGVAEAKYRNTRLVVVNNSRGDALVDKHIPNKEEFAEIRTRLESSGLDYSLEQKNQVDDLVEGLLEHITDGGDDVIVIGLRHRNPVGKLLMGSNAQRILLASPVPVLAVKAPE